MTEQQLTNILKTIRAIPEGSDEMAIAVLQAAADSISLDKLKSLTDSSQEVTEKDSGSSVLKFSAQEISKMPKTFRREFRTQGCTAHIRKRKSGPYNWNYEVRFRKFGYNIAVSSNNLAEAKQKFIAKLNEVDRFGSAAPSIPSTFDSFANYYFENFYKRKVAAETYRIGLNQYKNHILPNFGNVSMRKITPKACQDILDRLNEQGKGKTADDVYSLLNMIFKAAVKHNVLINNPLDMVFHTKHERQHGTALTKEEEKLLLESTAETPQQLMFAVGLYTGMRPNEYETAQLDGDFIVAINSKRKNGKVEYKKIPITPMLRPYLDGVDKLQFSSLRIMRDRFNKLFPKHKLYDLRTTFYTRCQECGISPVARDEFVGHSLGELGNTYTDLSDEFLLAEGQKFKY